MLTREENDLITRTGPGTPGGELLRRYWHPVALSSELPPDGAPQPVRVLGEDLVLFRDDQGRPGLLGLLCSHRCADLSYGRIEDGGLRCLYHGWLFDIAGRCLEQPAEPPESKYKDEIRHTAYPCVERAGLVLAYLGAGQPPLVPDYEFFGADEEHRFLQKTILDCNYLQALEGNIDPAHLSYLHRPIAKKDTRNVPGSKKSADDLYGEDLRPTIKVQTTEFGNRIFSVRSAGPGQQYVRITNFIMPNKAAIVGNEGRVGHGYSIHWHVPIDDTQHMRFDFVFNRVKPIDKAKYRERAEGELTPDNRLVRNRANRYLQDRAKMKTDNLCGMGDYFPAHDAFATETPGPIHDRTREHLVTTDMCIVAARRQLLDGIQAVLAGRDPLHVVRDPRQNDQSAMVVVSEVVPDSADYRDVWKKHVARRHAAE